MASPNCSSVLVAVILLLAGTSAHALEVVNKQRCDVTVFAPPICEPCVCPGSEPCFCRQQCRFRPGVTVKAGARATVPVRKEDYPLTFLTVEVKGQAYNVQADHLKSITSTATLVVTGKACTVVEPGKKTQVGIEAVVEYRSKPKVARRKRLCLVRGERYGS